MFSGRRHLRSNGLVRNEVHKAVVNGCMGKAHIRVRTEFPQGTLQPLALVRFPRRFEAPAQSNPR